MELPADRLKALKEPNPAHCADHSHFTQGCSVCRQACANFEPYPVRPSRPVARSFGFTDNLTEAKIDAMSTSRSEEEIFDEPELSLSLIVLRFVLRLIWPFSRII
jgi:hypothetical protein